jgi:phage repressor protein C with HTH and peptisase S24 domain
VTPTPGAARRVGLAVVRGRSMQPTLYDGDRLLVLHGAVTHPGDLVVVRLPRRRGGPTTGGQQVVAVKRAVRRDAGGWWVERDNRGEGVDSWTVGTVPDADVLARVLLRVWPLRRRVSRAPH